MSTILFVMIGIIVVLFLVLLVKLMTRSSPVIYDDYDDEEEVVTTTVTTVTVNEPAPNVVNGYTIEGDLTVQKQDDQYFVIDPADNKKTWINDGDDMYEDAAGKIWRLV